MPSDAHSSLSPLYLVDGYNLLHAVILRGRERAHFWSPENQRKVVELVARFEGGEAWVVFDASRPDSSHLEAPPGDVRCFYAESADERIVELAAAAKGERSVIVVSADRQLCDLARNHSATRMSPWDFAEACGLSRT